jgi:hypothetical protein
VNLKANKDNKNRNLGIMSEMVGSIDGVNDGKTLNKGVPSLRSLATAWVSSPSPAKL